MHNIAEKLSHELDKELKSILAYWCENSIDEVFGGFVAERDFKNNRVEGATKGIILNTRILWSFAAASNHYKTNDYLEICERSYAYLKTHFNDKKYDGVYWELREDGVPLNKKKQVYAQAFMIYALSEYYQVSPRKELLNWAITLFECIEKHSKDQMHGGYIEAFHHNWSVIEDMRLSDKDENVAKTMNTHLHILEAYTTLYKVYKSEHVKQCLEDLINLFLSKFLNPKEHMNLFFDREWNLKSDIISYGHDIECAWLLIEAARVIESSFLIPKTEHLAVVLAERFIAHGIDNDGGVFYEYNKKTAHLDDDKHWWPQAEAILGLKYVYDITKDSKYLEIALKIWDFTSTTLIDHQNGEWHWMVNKQGVPMVSEYKMGFWKAPYHNSRACMLFSRSKA